MRMIWNVFGSIVVTAFMAGRCLAFELSAAERVAATGPAFEQAFGSFADGASRPSFCAGAALPGSGDLATMLRSFVFECPYDSVSEGRGEGLAAAFQAVSRSSDARYDELTLALNAAADRQDAIFRRYVDNAWLPPAIVAAAIDGSPIPVHDAPPEDAAPSEPAPAAGAAGVDPMILEAGGLDAAITVETTFHDAARASDVKTIMTVEARAPEPVRPAERTEREVSAIDENATPEPVAEPAPIDMKPAPEVDRAERAVATPRRAGAASVRLAPIIKASRLSAIRPVTRRAVRQVSISRTISAAAPRPRLADAPIRTLRRQAPKQAAAAPPVVAARAPARSFSPKMSSAGPAQIR